jgi:hypothetical protein
LAAAARAVLALWLILGLAACNTAPTGDVSPFVLATHGAFVRSNAPPGIEVSLGSKLIRPADERTGSTRSCAVARAWGCPSPG